MFFNWGRILMLLVGLIIGVAGVTRYGTIIPAAIVWAAFLLED